MTSLGGEAWALYEGEFGEFYNGIDSHFDSLTIGDPEVFGGEMEATLPYFSGTDIPEIDDVDLSTAGFTDSLIGLEIFQSRNVLVDEGDESVDASAHSTELRIDEPLEELFNKFFSWLELHGFLSYTYCCAWMKFLELLCLDIMFLGWRIWLDYPKTKPTGF